VASGDTQRIIDQLVAVNIDSQNRGADAVALRCEIQNGLQPVEEHLTVRKTGEIVGQRILQQTLNGVLLLGDVGNRSHATDDFAVGAENRPGSDLQPVEMTIFGTNTEFMVEAAFAVI